MPFNAKRMKIRLCQICPAAHEKLGLQGFFALVLQHNRRVFWILKCRRTNRGEIISKKIKKRQFCLPVRCGRTQLSAFQIDLEIVWGL